ncbi:MAG: hypothetical protein R2823_00655 [Acidimicrobiia bacterium]
MKKALVAALVGLAVIASACSIDVEANPDGSLTVTSHIEEARFQAALDAMVDDPAVEQLEVEFFDGYVTVSGTGPDEFTGEIATIEFRADLGVEDGHLAVDISDATYNGNEVPRWMVAIWNESLARSLEREGRKDPDSTLTTVEVTDDDITMVWHVETEASKT